MPSDSRTTKPEGPGAAETELPADLSRRSVLRRAAGAGVATLAATTLVGSAGQALAATRPAGRAAGEHDDSDVADAQNVIVHIRDARSGEMDIFSGTSKTRLQDKALAARLVRAAG